MAKVSMHLGFTFRVGDLAKNQYGRLDLSIDQIDTDLPVDEQLEAVGYTADQVWDVLRTRVDSELGTIVDSNG